MRENTSSMLPRYLEMADQEVRETLALMPYRRAFIVGQTGSGKSHFIKRLWEGAPRKQLRFVYDSKGLFDVDGKGLPDPLSDQRVIGGIAELKRLLDREDDTYSIVFKPPRRLIEGRNARAYADAVLGLLFDHCVQRFNERRNRPWYGARIYVDELAAIATANDVPDHWNAFAARGRALQAALWGGTQRPVCIPGTAMSEAEIKIIGHLDTERDLIKVAQEMGCPYFRRSPQVIAEELGAQEGDPAWYSFWLRYGRKIRIVNV